jgi:Uma2 family endonuclease
MSIAPADPIAGRRHRLTVEDFHRMGRAGLFVPEARMELIEGEIIDRAPIGSAHASRGRRLADLLTTQLHGKAVIAVQDPVRLDDRSEPQPDVAVLRYCEDFYAAAHSCPGDILLIIEVADTTARFDREVKIPLYARHCIPEVWLLDLETGTMEVYR